MLINFLTVTSWQGVTRAGIKEGEWMAIVGCGGLGHLGTSYIFTDRPTLMIFRNSICKEARI